MNSDQQPYYYVDPPNQSRGDGGLIIGLCLGLVAGALAFLIFAVEIDAFLQTQAWRICRPILIGTAGLAVVYLVGRVALGAVLLIRDRFASRQG